MNQVQLKISILFISLISFSACSQTSFTSPGASSFTASSSDSGSGSASGTIHQTLSSLQPAMAVRSANCINCHGNSMASSLITDFGYGSSYFFSRNNGSPVGGDWVYSLRLDEDQNSSTYLPYWAQAQQYTGSAKIIVPQANLGFKYADYAPSWAPPSGWLNATTLPDLLTQIEQLPGAGNTPIVAKSTVFIGAPSPTQIRVAGGIDSAHALKFYPSVAASPAFSGLSYNGVYFTNSGSLVCDGDLFLDGALFLNQANVTTNNGCRIHTTGPIFVQKGISYTDGATNPNLQLVSARLISMGIGLSQCEATTDPGGWYNQTHIADPMKMRLVTMVTPDDDSFKDVRTRNTTGQAGFDQTAASPLAEGQALYAIAAQIQGLQDASCHGRELAFNRLLLVAPQIHSRYKGSFTGVIIAEFPLFSLGAFTYAFDPVFQNVSVLPKIPNTEYLVIQ